MTFAPSPEKMDLETSKSFKLVPSPSGANLFVEAPEYDPVAPHRPDDEQHNKGEGIGFLFSCLWCCRPAPAPEPAATAERHYSLPPSESMQNLLLNKVQ